MKCGNRETTSVVFDRKEVVASATRALQDYYDDMRANGMLAEFNWLDSSSSFFWVPPGYGGPISYDSVASVIRRNAALVKKIDERWEDLQIFPLTAEYISYTGRIRSDVTDSTGHTSTTRFLETGILIKKGNGWKLLCGQTGKLPD
jgi:hypothetical protein